MLKYRLEDEMFSEYVEQKQAACDKREMQAIAEDNVLLFINNKKREFRTFASAIQ